MARRPQQRFDIVDTGGGSFYGLSNGSNPLSRPDLLANAGPATAGFFFNPFAFARSVVQAGQPIPSSRGRAIAAAPGFDIGNVGRNILRGPRQADLDLSLARRFRIAEA